MIINIMASLQCNVAQSKVLKTVHIKNSRSLKYKCSALETVCAVFLPEAFVGEPLFVVATGVMKPAMHCTQPTTAGH